MGREIRVLVGIPSTGSIKPLTASSLISFIPCCDFQLDFTFVSGCYIHENRTNLALDALKKKATHLFFVDSDMWIHPNALNRLMSLNKSIVGLDYNQRQHPLVSTVKFADSYGNTVAKPGQEVPKDKPFRCFAVATGAMLINMEVFREIDNPWFFYESEKLYGEDLWFCRQAYRKGIEVWCDPTVPVKHIGDYAY
jgi:GT2 family glycosyltransferase